MKRVLLILASLVLLAGSAYANHPVIEGKIGDLLTKVVTSDHTFTVGDNTISITLSDLEGNQVAGEDMKVNYFMPSMPAMNYQASALPKDTKYETVIKPTMPGAWIADVSAIIKGKEQHVISFSFDVE